MHDTDFINKVKEDIENFRQDNPDEVDLNDSLDRALEDIKARRVTPWSEVKHKRLVH